MFILLNIIFIIFIQFIYSDIIEILTINELKNYTLYALLAKWGLVLLSVTTIGFILKGIVKSKKKNDLKDMQEEVKESTPVKSSFEEEIIKKETLKSKSDLMMEELMSKKSILTD